MENSIKLSIIVPVYKTEQYLRKCLSSILDQDVDKSLYEVIIVNDGSPDNSQVIINECCAKYDNVSCLVQSNQGLSMARNNGMEQAKGEYVWCIDSDDWVEKDSMERILSATSCNPDVVSINVTQPSIISNAFVTGKEILQSDNFHVGNVFHVFNRQFLIAHNLKWMPGVYHEDGEFLYRVLYFAETVIQLPVKLYNVYANTNSITRTINPKKSYDLLIVGRSIMRFRDDIVLEKELKTTFDNILGCLVNSALMHMSKCPKSEWLKFNKTLHAETRLLSTLKRGKLKYRLEYILFKILPMHYVQWYRFLTCYRR